MLCCYRKTFVVSNYRVIYLIVNVILTWWHSVLIKNHPWEHYRIRRPVLLLVWYCVRIQVLTAANMKTTVFWDIAPCSVVEVYRLFGGSCCLHHQSDGGSKHVWNVGKLLPDFTAQQPRRQLFSCSDIVFYSYCFCDFFDTCVMRRFKKRRKYLLAKMSAFSIPNTFEQNKLLCGYK
jgi:hypothetical protein